MASEVLTEGAISARAVSGFETLMELGRGGMGVAYLARSTGLAGFERMVVLKRLHGHLAVESDAMERFLHEARLAAYVNHANVVDVQHAAIDENGPYIVLAYVEGASLDELMDRASLKGTTMPVPIVLRVALDVLAGLEAIHNAKRPTGEPLNVLHRDVTPHNMLVGRDGVSRVADFGIAKSTLRGVSTEKGYMVGKLLYMAPEYLRQLPVGPQLDVYSVGVSLWSAFSGSEPWPEADDAQLMALIFTQGVPPVSTVAQLPPQVASIVDRACHMDVEQRYPTARTLANAIEQLGRETSWVASHQEVAAYVEELAGPELARRREYVARLAPRAPSLPPQEEPFLLAPARPVEPPPSGVMSVTTRVTRKRSRKLVGVAAVGVVLVALTAAVVRVRGALDAAVVSPESAAVASPASPAANPLPPATAETRVPTSVPIDPRTLPSAEGEPGLEPALGEPEEGSPRGARKLEGRRAARASSPAVEPILRSWPERLETAPAAPETTLPPATPREEKPNPPAPMPAPPPPPSEITKKNPYL